MVLIIPQLYNTDHYDDASKEDHSQDFLEVDPLLILDNEIQGNGHFTPKQLQKILIFHNSLKKLKLPIFKTRWILMNANSRFSQSLK